jgi:lysyl-tRNA synthetase, class I
MEEWLAYAPVESLAYFIFRDPRAAKKLYVDMIPKTMDEYLDQLRRYPDVPEDKKPDSPLWHIHRRGSAVPAYQSPVNFTMVNNLVSALGMEQPEPEKIAEFLTNYDPEISAYADVLMTLIDKGVAYYLDRILPNKVYRDPTDEEKQIFMALKARLQEPDAADLDQKALQSLIFDLAKDAGMDPKNFFGAIYQVLLGQAQGPRFGSFAKLVGVARVIELIEQRIG